MDDQMLRRESTGQHEDAAVVRPHVIQVREHHEIVAEHRPIRLLLASDGGPALSEVGAGRVVIPVDFSLIRWCK